MWRLTLRLAAVVILVTSVPLQGMGEGVPESWAQVEETALGENWMPPKKMRCYHVTLS